jgi:hypothetical protein
MTGPLSAGLTTTTSGVGATIFAASLPTKLTTSISGGGVTVVPSQYHQQQQQQQQLHHFQPQTVHLTIPSANKVHQAMYETMGSNGSGVTVNLTTSQDDDMDTSSSQDMFDVPHATSEEIVSSPRVEVKPIVDEPEMKRAKFD